MKKLILKITLVLIIVAASCQVPAKEEAEVSKVETPDYAAFDKKVAILRSYMQAYCDKNLDAMMAVLSDTLKWSPASFNGNQWLGKEDFKTVIAGYHENFENIKFAEGIVLADNTSEGGMWSGSVFPKETANNSPSAIRTYGTFTATHTPSGKDVGVKWFGLIWINDEGMITQMSEYFDVNGIAVQLAAE